MLNSTRRRYKLAVFVFLVFYLLKVVTHMMPDLPNVGLERDIEQFMEFFENPAFRPDGLKLYPTLVIRGTGRCNLQIRGGGEPAIRPDGLKLYPTLVLRGTGRCNL